MNNEKPIGGGFPIPAPVEKKVVPFGQVWQKDGTMNELQALAYSGDAGQRAGYTQARDIGAAREFGRSYKAGLKRAASSYANTFGFEEFKADMDVYFDTNKQLEDSERKGTWSYTANLIGSQFGQNTPLFASMLVPGMFAGRVGAKALAGAARAAETKLAGRISTLAPQVAAKTIWNTAEKTTYESIRKKAIERGVAELGEKAIASKVSAVRATTMATMSAMLWGDTGDELRERMPGVDESTLQAIKIVLVPLQAAIEISPFGFETRTARAAGRIVLGNAMAKGMSQRFTKNVVKPGLWGKLQRVGESFPGRVIKTGGGETFEEMLQEGSKDMAVSMFKTGKENDETAEEVISRYGRLIKESFIGGVGLGFVPATLNSIANTRRKTTINNIVKEDVIKQKKVDEFNSMVVDVAAPQSTKLFFDRMTSEFGKEAGNLIRNVAYNLAHLEITANNKPKLPQEYFSDLTTLSIEDPAKFAELRDTFIHKGVVAGVEQMNGLFPDMKDKIVHWAEVDMMNEQDRVHSGLRAEINEKAGIDLFDINAVENLQQAARNIVADKIGGTGIEDELHFMAKKTHLAVGSEERIIAPEYMANILKGLGEANLRNLYALRWIRKVPVKVGEDTKLMAIQLRMDDKGVISGVVFTDEMAEGMAEHEAKRLQKEAKTKEVVEPTKKFVKGQEELGKPVPPALLINAEPIAIKMAQTIFLGSIRSRFEEFDVRRKVEPVAPTPTEPEVLTARTTDEMFSDWENAAWEQKKGKTYAELIAERRKAGGVVAKEARMKQIKSELLNEGADKEKLNVEYKQLEEDVTHIEAGDTERLLPLAQVQKKIDIESEVFTAKERKVKPKEKVKLTGNPALYLPAYRLGLFYQKADAQSFTEELLHHLIANELMPNNVHQALVDNFGTAVDGEEPFLDRAGHENAARALSAYLSSNELPDNPQIVGFFKALKDIIASSGEIKKIAMTASGLTETDVPWNLSNDLKSIFDNLLSEVTPDKVSQIYGEALDESLNMGEQVRFVDEERMFRNARVVAKSQGLATEQYIDNILLETIEAIDNKDSINNLTLPQKLSVQDRVDLDLRQVLAGTGKEEKMETIKPEDVLGPEVLTARPVDEMEPEEFNSYAHSDAVFSGTPNNQRHDKLHRKTIELFPDKTSWGDPTLSRNQKIQVIDEFRPPLQRKAVSVEAQARAKVIADNVTPSLRGDLTILWSDNVFTKIGKWTALKGIHIINRIETIRGLVNILAENNPDSMLVKAISNPITIANDDASNDFNKLLIPSISKQMNARGKTWEFPYHSVQIGDRLFRKTQALYYYVQSNGGKDMGKNSKVVQIALANNLGKTTEKAFEVVKKMVEVVKADSDMMAFVDVTQDVMNSYFNEKARPTYKKVTGKDIKPIKELYITIANQGGDVFREDVAAIFEHLAGLPSFLTQTGTTPREFFHRGKGDSRMANDDYYGLVFRHLASMSNYANKAEVVKSIMESINTDTVRDAFRENNLEMEYLDTLHNLLRREMSPKGKLNTASLPTDNTIKFLTGNASKVLLAWNIGPIMNQFLSVPLFMATVSARLAGRFMINMLDLSGQMALGTRFEDTTAFKLLEKHSPGFLELRPSPDVRKVNEILETKTGIGVGTKGGLMFSKFLDWGMRPLQFFDMLPRLTAWQTAFDGKLEMLGDTSLDQQEKESAAKSFADDTVNKSFNPASRAERGLFQSEAPEAIKSTMLFTSQPFASCRWFISDLMLPVLKAWNKGGFLGVAGTLKNNPALFYKMSMGVFIPGLVLGALGRRRPPKDMREVLTDAFLFGVCNHIPVLGHILWYNAAFGFGGTGADLGGVHGRLASEMVKAVGDIIGGKADFSTLRSAEMTIEMLTRFPDYPVRLIHRLTDNVYLQNKDNSVDNLREILFGKRQP